MAYIMPWKLYHFFLFDSTFSLSMLLV